MVDYWSTKLLYLCCHGWSRRERILPDHDEMGQTLARILEGDLLEVCGD